MALPVRAQRVIRTLRQFIPSGVVLGRRSGGEGPVEFIPLDEITDAQLDAITDVRGSILYRGASGWVGLAPGTVGHFLKTNGAGADPAWAAAAGSGGGGFFGPNTPPDLADFSAVTGGTGASTNSDASDRGLSMIMTAGANDNWSLLVKTQASGDFTAIAGMITMPGGNSGFPGCGFVARDTSSGRHILIGFESLLTAPKVLCQRWNSTTAFGANLSTAQEIRGYYLYVKFERSGTDLITSYSLDGVSYVQLVSTTEAAQGMTVDQVGFGVKAHTSFPSLVVPFFDEA